jgi:F0F1-type ATP synthase beta subunit
MQETKVLLAQQGHWCVQFDTDNLLPNLNALGVQNFQGGRLALESHLGENAVRTTIAMDVQRSNVVDTGSPILVPVGVANLGRIMNVIWRTH